MLYEPASAPVGSENPSGPTLLVCGGLGETGGLGRFDEPEIAFPALVFYFYLFRKPQRLGWHPALEALGTPKPSST